MGRERNQPLSHGNVQLQRRIGVDDAQQGWPRLQTVRRRAQHDCRHLDPVHGAGVAQRLGLPAFVEQPDLRVINIQMPGVGGQIQWLERPAAFLVQHVQCLDQAHVILHFGECPIAPAPVVVHHIGGATNSAVDAIFSPDFQRFQRVTGVKRECGGHCTQPVHHQCGVKAHHVAPHLCPGNPVQIAGGWVQDPHADDGQYPQCGGVDGGDLIVADDPDRGIGVRGLAKAALRQTARGAQGAGAGSAHGLVPATVSTKATGLSRRTTGVSWPKVCAVLCA